MASKNVPFQHLENSYVAMIFLSRNQVLLEGEYFQAEL
jgi:hypothetical protein